MKVKRKPSKYSIQLSAAGCWLARSIRRRLLLAGARRWMFVMLSRLAEPILDGLMGLPLLEVTDEN